jgi:hypothetical protein
LKEKKEVVDERKVYGHFFLWDSREMCIGLVGYPRGKNEIPFLLQIFPIYWNLSFQTPKFKRISIAAQKKKKKKKKKR